MIYKIPFYHVDVNRLSDQSGGRNLGRKATADVIIVSNFNVCSQLPPLVLASLRPPMIRPREVLTSPGRRAELDRDIMPTTLAKPNLKHGDTNHLASPHSDCAIATPHSQINLHEKDSTGLPRFGWCIITGQLTSNRWYPKRPHRDSDVGSIIL